MDFFIFPALDIRRPPCYIIRLRKFFTDFYEKNGVWRKYDRRCRIRGGVAGVRMLLDGTGQQLSARHGFRPASGKGRHRGEKHQSAFPDAPRRGRSAGEALEIAIGNSNIGVYKYDITNSAQRHRLEVIRKSKRIYFNGIPYPIYEVSGSFIVVGLDKHKDKKRILESLRHFK